MYKITLLRVVNLFTYFRCRHNNFSSSLLFSRRFCGMVNRKIFRFFSVVHLFCLSFHVLLQKSVSNVSERKLVISQQKRWSQANFLFLLFSFSFFASLVLFLSLLFSLTHSCDYSLEKWKFNVIDISFIWILAKLIEDDELPMISSTQSCCFSICFRIKYMRLLCVSINLGVYVSRKFYCL